MTQQGGKEKDRWEEKRQGRRKETPGGPFDGNGWVLGRGEVQNDKGGKGQA